jgi:predicted acyl esterase
VEAIAGLSWCSGKIAPAGNSWLAMSQWRTADFTYQFGADTEDTG